MIRIELESARLVLPATCRGRVLVQPGAPSASDGAAAIERIAVTLYASQLVRQPFSGKAPTRCVLFEHTVELGAVPAEGESVLPFELKLPTPEEASLPTRPPGWLVRLVTWLAPDAVRPVTWEVRVRAELSDGSELEANAAFEVSGAAYGLAA